MSIIRNMFVSTSHRDIVKYPSASDFTVDIPLLVKNVFAVVVRNFKYTPEKVINNHNNTFSFTANSGAATGQLKIENGDYNNSIDDILFALNTILAPYDVQFQIDGATQKVEFTFAGTFVTDYFAIPACKLLTLLGFPSGICLYRTGSAPSPLPANTDGYDTAALATNMYYTYNNTDLILRITDVEAILSSHGPSNRATAVILSSRVPNSVVENTPVNPFPLLQIQQRIQQLRIKILNSDGDLYDLNDEPASFIIEFHCQSNQNELQM